MNVLELNNIEFSQVCNELGGMVVKSNYCPDLIVGIATGGMIVANEIKNSGKFERTNFISIISRRPLTKVKGKIGLEKVLKVFPVWVNNYLRILESNFRQLALKKNSKRTVEMSDESTSLIKAAKRLLIVDDAIDSGITLYSVIERIHEINKSLEIKTAVITVTWKKPVLKPDFQVYSQLLVRFPWSADAR